MYVSSKRACEVLHVSSATLRRWQSDGKIVAQVLPSGHRRYLVGDHSGQGNAGHEKIVYCRVSSPKQKADLYRQSEFLSGQYPEHRLVTDVGSGIN